jgi:aquaporin Z
MKTKGLLAEFIGTFALVFTGAFAVALGVGGLLVAAYAQGLTLLVIGYDYGNIFEAHIDPVFTVGLWFGNAENFALAAIGQTLTFSILICSSVTGASLNPARN